MSLIVQKFGGTSVGSIDRIEQVADKVAKFRSQRHGVVVVVSAMGGETNRLIELAHEIQERPTPREMDVLVSTGEQVTTALLSMALNKRGVKAKSYNGSQGLAAYGDDDPTVGPPVVRAGRRIFNVLVQLFVQVFQ